MLPGKRDGLIDLFEAHFIEGQEDTGMKIIGTFRDLDDDAKLVWLRGFTGMDERARSLTDFYSGPVWRSNREAANSTMVDIDDVLLLRPARGESDFALAGERPPLDAVESERGVVEATILNFSVEAADTTLAHYEREIAPRIADAGGAVLACLVTEPSANTFPALPIREGESVLAWFAGFPDRGAYDAAQAARAEIQRAAADSPHLVSAPHVLRLVPTRRSLLAGSTSRVAGAVPPRA